MNQIQLAVCFCTACKLRVVSTYGKVDQTSNKECVADWRKKLKIFTIWSFTEKAFQLLQYMRRNNVYHFKLVQGIKLNDKIHANNFSQAQEEEKKKKMSKISGIK